MRGFLLALFKKVKCECFATQRARLTVRAGQDSALTFLVMFMDNLKFYEINPKYVKYLSAAAPHLFLNKQSGQRNERKYIGIVLHINGLDYFAPLSSFKDKHRRMKESVDFIKIKDYAVINLNNMFPVPPAECTYVNIQNETDFKYRDLLRAEYRYIKMIQEKIRKNADTVYRLRLKDGDTTALGKRCNNFTLLEKMCKEYR